MKNKRGITLIALVITIIILLILAGITINQITENGLINKEQKAVEKYKLGEIEEKLQLAIHDYQTNLDGKTLYNILQDLDDVESVKSEKSQEVLPYSVIIGGYVFKIEEDYSISYIMKKPIIIIEKQKIDEKIKVKITIKVEDVKELEKIIISREEKEIGELLLENQKEKTQEFDINEIGQYKVKVLTRNGKQAVIDEINIEQAVWQALLNKAGIDFSIYNNFKESLTEENVNQIINSEDAMNYIGMLFDNEEYFQLIADNQKLMDAVCNNDLSRQYMYDNYNVTENIIANSTIALNSMKNSNRYQMIQRSISKYAGSISFTNMYNDKAFILGVSQNRNTDGGFKTEVGNILSISGGILKISAANTYGSTGLKYTINKFASIVRMDPYGRDPSQSSINITINAYIAIFKI